MKKKVAQKVNPPEKKSWLEGKRPFLILALLGFLVYLPTLWCGFSPLDERWLIVKQLGILGHVSNLPVIFSSAITGMYYRPVLMSSFMFDVIVGNGGPLMFHLSNILIHVACALLLFRFLIQLNLSKLTAFMAAAIFAVHPLTIHTVAWIPGRNDSLLCLFALISCIHLLNYFNTRKKIHLAVHLFAFVLALLTKENGIVLPFIYLLLWLFIKKEKDYDQLLIIGASWMVLCVGWFLTREHFVSYLPAKTAASFGQSILNFFEGLVVFSGKTVLPLCQSVMAILPDAAITLFLLATLFIAGLAAKFRFHNNKIALIGICWFFGFLVMPVWFGVTTTNMDLFEHRVYTSLIGAFLFLTQLKITINPVVARRGFLLLLILFSIKTVSRSAVYKDEISFLEAATTESPSMALMHDMLGYKYTEMKKYKEAQYCFDEAIRLNPSREKFYNHRGNLYYQTKNYPLALEDFNKTLAMNDTQAITYVNRSMTNFYLGNHTASLRDIERAGKEGATNIPPEFIEALYSAFQNDTIALCTKKLQVDSSDASTYNQRGIARMRLHLYKEALEDFNRALVLRPNSDAIRSNQRLALSNLQQKK
jgi:tetratricopeptide (TPR) repeat protein